METGTNNSNAQASGKQGKNNKKNNKKNKKKIENISDGMKEDEAQIIQSNEDQ